MHRNCHPDTKLPITHLHFLLSTSQLLNCWLIRSHGHLSLIRKSGYFKFKFKFKKMFIAIIHNMNTWGRYCIRLSHQIALQYTSQLSTENYTLVTVQHIRETNNTYYGNGSTKPFRIYGLHIWSTFNAYTKNRCKVQNIFNELCTVILMSWHKAAASPLG